MALRYFRDQFARPLLKRKPSALVAEVRAFARQEGFRQDWYSVNIPVWMELFDKRAFRSRPIQAMGIGSLEGLSPVASSCSFRRLD